jgi:hypothetical protein
LRFLGHRMGAAVSPAPRSPLYLQALGIWFSGTWKNNGTKPISFLVYNQAEVPLFGAPTAATDDAHYGLAPPQRGSGGNLPVQVRRVFGRIGLRLMPSHDPIILAPGQRAVRTYKAAVQAFDPFVLDLRPGYKVGFNLPLCVQGMLNRVRISLSEPIVLGRLRPR